MIVRDVRSAVLYRMARSFLILLGLASIGWSGFSFPKFWQQTKLSDISAEYVEGHSFDMRSLLQEAQRSRPIGHRPFCNPSILHDVVLLRLAILEEAVTQHNQLLANSAVAPLYDASRASLSCAPTDPFVWLALFWVDSNRHGIQPSNGRFLRLSYMLGPNEGWIALWRNQLAMKLFGNLPDDLAADALDEFVKLVNTQRLYEQTLTIFMAATPSVQSRIANRLKTSNTVSRQIFANLLYTRGVDLRILRTFAPAWQPSNQRSVEITLPGVELPNQRP